jgi:hypothetical protein
LARQPFRRRVLGHRKSQQLPPSMAKDERHSHIEQVKAVLDRGEARLRHWNHIAGLSARRQ